MGTSRTYEVAKETGPILQHYQGSSIDNDKDLAKMMDKFKKVSTTAEYAQLHSLATALPPMRD